MPLDQIKVDIDDLALGMYVSRLDRPWIETPFPLQGYYIKETQDISNLRTYCNYVYIDIRRGKSPIDPVFLENLDSSVTSSNKIRAKKRPVTVKKLKARKGIYKYTSSPAKEVKNARKIHQMAILASSYIEHALKNHTMIPIAETKKVVCQLVDNVIKNPDAYLWLTKIKNKDSHLYGQSVRITIWAISLGRHLGISREALNNLAMGIMLSGVGKAELPKNLLKKDPTEMTPDELEGFQDHVKHAVKLLKDNSNLEDQALGIVMNMHERNDGTGYPRGLLGDEIPYLAKLAGIASAYDELTFPINAEFGLSPSDAIAKLYRTINQTFQKDLVEEFIQAIGIYPAGTLVELSTSETAMVLEQNSERRLRPRILLLLDSEKKMYSKFKTIDLMKKENTSDGLRLEITYSLPIGSYGADPEMIYEKAFTSRWSFSRAS